MAAHTLPHTNRDMNQSELDTLEALIDAHGLLAITEALMSICYDKAVHLEEAWQDHASARVWTQAAKFFAKPNASVQAL
jgi:hypothetical protein